MIDLPWPPGGPRGRPHGTALAPWRRRCRRRV